MHTTRPDAHAGKTSMEYVKCDYDIDYPIVSVSSGEAAVVARRFQGVSS